MTVGGGVDGLRTRHGGALDRTRFAPLVEDLAAPRAPVYWLDFGASALGTLGLTAFAMVQPAFSAAQVLAVLAAALLGFRSGVFVHELFHFGRKLQGFYWLYHLLYGFPFKLPLYAYLPHRAHHAPKSYGTLGDPEYDDITGRPPWTLLLPLVIFLAFPVLATLRFGFLPLALPFAGERVRARVWRHGSSLAMNLRYRRPPPTPAERKEWLVEDTGCAAYNGAFFLAMGFGVLPWSALGVYWAVLYLAFLMNPLPGPDQPPVSEWLGGVHPGRATGGFLHHHRSRLAQRVVVPGGSALPCPPPPVPGSALPQPARGPSPADGGSARGPPLSQRSAPRLPVRGGGADRELRDGGSSWVRPGGRVRGADDRSGVTPAPVDYH